MFSYWLRYTLVAGLQLSLLIAGGKPVCSLDSTTSLMEDSCPDENAIKPCFCSAEDGELEMDCSQVTSEDDLRAVFNQDLNTTHFHRLTIKYNAHIKEIKAGDLGNATFEVVHITYCALYQITEAALENSIDTLIELDLSDNVLTSVPNITIFKKLEQLIMFYNNLTSFPHVESTTLTLLALGSLNIDKVPVDALAGVPNIETFQLNECSVTEIENDTFTKSEHLSYLSLDSNELTTLSEDAVKLHGNATRLSLMRNQITHLTPEVVADVNSHLSLATNNMTELPEKVFRPLLERDVLLYLWENPFGCHCDIAWLILNNTLFQKLPFLDHQTFHPTCADGRAFVDLDPLYYKTNCQNVTVGQFDRM